MGNKRTVPRVCQKCGKDFLAKTQEVNKGYAKYCSNKCTIKHGFTNHPIYHIWRTMIARCHRKTAKNYSQYGAKGVFVCERWRENPQHIIEDIGPRPSDKHMIDRIDPTGNYEPNNCRWVTAKQSCYNTRGVSTSTSKYKGVSWDTNSSKWKVGIKCEKKVFHLGYFNDEKIAASVYNDKAKELFGEYAYLNDV